MPPATIQVWHLWTEGGGRGVSRKPHTAVEICENLAQAEGESLSQIYPSEEPHIGQKLSTSSLLLFLVIGKEQPTGSMDQCEYYSKVKDVVAGYCPSPIFPQ